MRALLGTASLFCKGAIKSCPRLTPFVPALDTGCMCLTPFCNEVEWCVLPTRLNGMKKMEKKEENRDMPGRHFRVRSREVVAGRVGVYAFLGIEG